MRKDSNVVVRGLRQCSTDVGRVSTLNVDDLIVDYESYVVKSGDPSERAVIFRLQSRRNDALTHKVSIENDGAPDVRACKSGR